MRILNGYAGIGGNTANWDREKHDIVAVEINPEIAEEYERIHPEDEVIIGDAHEYLKDNYEKFDFIWMSPPCPTHSKMVPIQVNSEYKQNASIQARYPDMKLYQEIIFLKYFFDGDWAVENVNPYYRDDIQYKKSDMLVEPQEVARHLIWSNFSVGKINLENINLMDASREELEEWLGIEVEGNIYLKDNHDPLQILRNCVHPKIGEIVLKSRNTTQTSIGGDFS